MLDPFPFFTEMRLRHRGFYTDLPIEAIRQYIESLDLSPEEKVQALASIGQPSVKMTCPVCGQPSTHLVLCKGCGGGSFEHLLDWDEETGEPDYSLLEEVQAAFREAMSRFGEAAEHAAKRVYHHGGCMVCEHCWDGALINWSECPVRLFEDAQEWFLWASVRLGALLREEGVDPRSEEGLRQLALLLDGEVAHLRFRWCEGWNWGETEEQREAIAGWREALLTAAVERHAQRLRGGRG